MWRRTELTVHRCMPVKHVVLNTGIVFPGHARPTFRPFVGADFSATLAAEAWYRRLRFCWLAWCSSCLLRAKPLKKPYLKDRMTFVGVCRLQCPLTADLGVNMPFQNPSTSQTIDDISHSCMIGISVHFAREYNVKLVQ